ncbi:MAG: hypothetical protein PF588_09615 [Candidatus Kapabacteria bacterium]|jgi:hypothetical protein|nr:hypothetical protein [Candidatus Kapabacteria bacterium]
MKSIKDKIDKELKKELANKLHEKASKDISLGTSDSVKINDMMDEIETVADDIKTTLSDI